MGLLLLILNSPDLLDPSSVTMPRPSALFCLSKAFKSRTLKNKTKQNKLISDRILSPFSRDVCNLQLEALTLNNSSILLTQNKPE